MPGTPIIARDPVATIVTDPDGSSSSVDFSCFIRRIEWQPDAETINAPTLCEPTRTEIGTVTWSCVVTIAWSEDAYTAIAAIVGDEVELQAKYNSGDTKAVVGRVRFPFAPIGSIDPGQVSEVDVPVACLNAPAYTTP